MGELLSLAAGVAFATLAIFTGLVIWYWGKEAEQ